MPSSRLRPSQSNSISSRVPASGSATQPWTGSHTGSRTAAAEDQTSRAAQGPAPSQARSPPAFHARASAGRGGGSDRRASASPEQPRKRVSAAGGTLQLAGKKLGDICEDSTRKDLKRSSKGGESSSLCSGREFLQGGLKFSRVSEKDQDRIL